MSKKLMRKKLALMLATLKKKRPYYCEVEYLESTGTQYIDAGLNYFADFEVGIKLRNNVSNKALGNVQNNCMERNNATDHNWRFSSNGSWGSNIDILEYHVMKWKENKIYADGVLLTEKVKAKGTGNMTLFGVSAYYPNMIYFCKLWNPDNGELVRDLIPVLDWDYVPCLYDKVSGQFFYNQGTGDFLYGREIHYVDYLESTGIEYIDTGIIGKTGVKAFIDFEWLNGNIGNDRYVIAASTSSTRTYFGTFQSKWMFGNGPYIQAEGIQENVRYNAEISWLLDNSYVDINGNRIITSTTTGEVNTNLTLWLFSRNQEYFRTGWSSVIKMYSCKIYEVNTLVRDYLPAIDENGVGFMFDRVTHTCFLNQGTGAFKYPARETEYTANAGTLAYIDLGVKYKPSMTIEGKYTRNSSGSNGSVILLSTTTSPPLIYLPALSGTTKERFIWRRIGYTEQGYYINNIKYPFTAEIKIDAVKDTLTVNNEIVKTGMITGMNGYDSPYESYSNMYMFSITGSYAGDGNVSYLKITDGTTPLFDLIPAYKDGEAGFYNKVDGTFYKNASTHSNAKLTAGKIKENLYE